MHTLKHVRCIMILITCIHEGVRCESVSSTGDKLYLLGNGALSVWHPEAPDCSLCGSRWYFYLVVKKKKKKQDKNNRHKTSKQCQRKCHLLTYTYRVWQEAQTHWRWAALARLSFSHHLSISLPHLELHSAGPQCPQGRCLRPAECLQTFVSSKTCDLPKEKKLNNFRLHL